MGYVREFLTFSGLFQFLPFQFIPYCIPPYKVGMLTHTYPHKPLRKIKVTICNHQADSAVQVWPDVWSGDLQVLKKYGHTCHRMSLLRPGAIKQNKPNLIVSAINMLWNVLWFGVEHSILLIMQQQSSKKKLNNGYYNKWIKFFWRKTEQLLSIRIYIRIHFYWNPLLDTLLSSGENSSLSQQLMPIKSLTN